MWGVITMMTSTLILVPIFSRKKILKNRDSTESGNAFCRCEVLFGENSSNDTGFSLFETNFMLYFTIGENRIPIFA